MFKLLFQKKLLQSFLHFNLLIMIQLLFIFTKIQLYHFIL